MANINDYLLWRGDLSFEERSFNDVDNLILSALIYLDFTGIVPEQDQGESISVRKACKLFLEQCGNDITPRVRSLAKIDRRFVELLGSSSRFGSARLHSYVDIVDDQRSLQFAAMQIDMPDAGRYVAYRGTDLSIVGWRENFMLSFTITEAQREATRYLQHALEQTPESMTLWVGGHSKGGNLAEYAAITCSEQLQRRIARVYSNDGPSSAPEVFQVPDQLSKQTIIRHIVPTYSVIGMLFDNEADPRTIVKSTAVGVDQHDLTTWHVTPKGFEKADELLPECVVINRSIREWADEVPLKEREQVINQVFDALEAGGATTFDEITSTPEHMQRVARALAATDERTHEVALALARHALDSSIETVRIAAKRLIDDTGRRLFKR